MKKREINCQHSIEEALKIQANFEMTYDPNAAPMMLKSFIQLEETFSANIEFKDGRFQYRVEPLENAKT